MSIFKQCAHKQQMTTFFEIAVCPQSDTRSITTLDPRILYHPGIPVTLLTGSSSNIEAILAAINTIELVVEKMPEKNSGPYASTHFYIFTAIFHHLEGLLGSNITITSQLASQFSWQSAASVSQRSWVQIPSGHEFLFMPYFNFSSVVFIGARIAPIFVSSTAVHIYDFHIFTESY